MRLLLAWCLLSSTTSAFCKEWTLDEIIKFGDQNSDQISIIENTKVQSVAEIDAYRGAAFPRVDADISVMRTSTPTQNIFNQQAFLQAGNGSMEFPERLYANQYGLNLNLNAPLYTFGRFGSVLGIARQMEKQADLQKDLSKTQHHLKTITLYTEALLAVNLERVAATNEKLSENLLEFTKLDYSSGARSKADFLRTKANYEIAKAENLKRKLEAETKQQRLQDYLNYNDGILKIKAGTDHPTQLFKKIDPEASHERTDLKISRLSESIANDTHDYRKADYYPSLSLAGSLTSNLTGSDFSPAQDAKFNDIFDKNNHSYAIGLVLKWNLFDGFQTSSQVKKAAAERVLASLNAKQLRKEAKLDRIEAGRKFRIAEIMYEASRNAVEASKIALEVAESDYKAGSISLTELLEVQKQFLESETQKFSSYSDKIISAAKMRYELGIKIYNDEASK